MTPALDLDLLKSWIGRTESCADRLHPGPARRLAATLDGPAQGWIEGTPLPPLWHWLYFLDAVPAHQLGPDGHAARGGFLPPVPLPQRMWAGGRVAFEHPLHIGQPVDKHSRILDVTHKVGRSGDLVFVTVEHEVFSGGQRCVREEQDLVYKGGGGHPPVLQPTPEPPPGTPLHEGADRVWTPDAVQLFRYSALTFNGHRIHYDADYCREHEGYPAAVIHGPLSATVLAAHAETCLGRPLQHIHYRGERPAWLGLSLALHHSVSADGMAVWTTRPDGSVAMTAQVG